MNLTFDQIKEHCHDLGYLEYLVRHISSRGDKSFCANHIWYGVIKRDLSQMVGWSSIWEVRAEKLLIMSADEFSNINNIENKVQYVCASDNIRNIMRSCEAYDIAYQHLYNLLPDCRHEGDCF